MQPTGADIDRAGVVQRVAVVNGGVSPFLQAEIVAAAIHVDREAAAQGQRVAAVIVGAVAGAEGVGVTAAEVQRRIVQRLAVQDRDAAVVGSRQVDAAGAGAVCPLQRQAALDEQVSARQRQHALIGDPRQRAASKCGPRGLDDAASDGAVQRDAARRAAERQCPAGIVQHAIDVQRAAADGDAAAVVKAAAKNVQPATSDVDAAGVGERTIVYVQPAGADIDRAGIGQRIAAVVGVVCPILVTEIVAAAVDVDGEAAAQGQRVAAVVAAARGEGVAVATAEVQRRVVQRLAVQYRNAAVGRSRQVDAAGAAAVGPLERQPTLDEQGPVPTGKGQQALVSDAFEHAALGHQRGAGILDHPAGNGAVQVEAAGEQGKLAAQGQRAAIGDRCAGRIEGQGAGNGEGGYRDGVRSVRGDQGAVAGRWGGAGRPIGCRCPVP